MKPQKPRLHSPDKSPRLEPKPGKTIVIKLGGSVLKDLNLLHSLCEDLRKLQWSGFSPVVVHGGGPAINEELTLRGISWQFHQGLRITTQPMMDVIEMVLCGKINRHLVRALNASGTKAVGISGADGNLLRCIPADPILGQVGQIEQVDIHLLNQLLTPAPNHAQGLIPIIAPIGIDAAGNAYNINADWAASKIAQAMRVDNLIYITDQNGVLDSNGNTLSLLDERQMLDLIETNIVHGGMLAKVRTILDALTGPKNPKIKPLRPKNNPSKVQKVHILNAKTPQAILEAALDRSPSGTACQLRTASVEL